MIPEPLFPVVNQPVHVLAGKLGKAYFYAFPTVGPICSSGSWVLEMTEYCQTSSGAFAVYWGQPEASEAEFVVYVSEMAAAPGTELNALDPSTFAATVEPWLEIPVFVLDGYPVPSTDKAMRLIVCALLDQRIQLDVEWYESISETALDDLIEDILFREVQA